MTFWHEIYPPILGLSPMDGVTDAPYRLITAKHGRPDLHMTEFTNVEGLARGAVLMLDDFLYSEVERPVIAQVYGSEVQSFYKIALIVCELGFDGIDINMGCPAKKVARRGCGAGLIKTPDLARQIIRAVKQGVTDWVNGKNIEDLNLKTKMLRRVREMNQGRIGEEKTATRKALPVSVKTRLGYDSIVIEDWVKHLLEEEPVAISIHGRTLKQMYSGEADWEAIGRAAEIIHQTQTLVLGNGDLTTPEQIVDRVRQTGVDGVLLGRGALGNPWIFSHKEKIKEKVAQGKTWQEELHPIEIERRFEVLMEHAKAFERIKGQKRFSAMRKHFGWYCKGMPQAAALRNRMCQTSSAREVEKVLEEYLKKVNSSANFNLI